MLFRDRREAGEQLSAALRIYQDRRPHILAIPRGGVVVGYEVAVALRAVRGLRPAWLVVAIPVAPADSTHRLHAEADDVVCLHSPPVFYAVGQFYENFAQTTDDEVIALLRQREAELKDGPLASGSGPRPEDAHGL